MSKFNDLFASKTYPEATEKIYAVAKYYPDFVRVFQPAQPFDKLLSGMEATKKLDRTKGSYNQSPEDDLLRSLRRSKNKITDYVLCNRFELFATFTFKDDRQNVDRCKRKMSDWIKNQQKRKGKFSYLIIPELHKDRESLHFHALLKNYGGRLKIATNPNNGRIVAANGKFIYTIPSYRLGFTNVVKIDDTEESHARVGSYVRKYITKDMPLFFGKNRYWASRGLLLPHIEHNPSDWYLNKTPIRFYESKYGLTQDFSLKDGAVE
jgi:hypothetical protein